MSQTTDLLQLRYLLSTSDALTFIAILRTLNITLSLSEDWEPSYISSQIDLALSTFSSLPRTARRRLLREATKFHKSHSRSHLHSLSKK